MGSPSFEKLRAHWPCRTQDKAIRGEGWTLTSMEFFQAYDFRDHTPLEASDVALCCHGLWWEPKQENSLTLWGVVKWKWQALYFCFCSLASLMGFFLLMLGFITYKTPNGLDHKRNKASPSHSKDPPHTWKSYKYSIKSLDWISAVFSHLFNKYIFSTYCDLDSVLSTRGIAVNKAKVLSSWRSHPA